MHEILFVSFSKNTKCMNLILNENIYIFKEIFYLIPTQRVRMIDVYSKVCTKNFFFYDFLLLCTNISRICTSCKVKNVSQFSFFEDFNVPNQKFLAIIEFTGYQFLIF